MFHKNLTADQELQRIGHLCLEVDDLGPLRSRLMDAGFAVTEPMLGADHSRQMWVTDPDGTSIELHQYTPQSCQITGAECTVNW